MMERCAIIGAGISGLSAAYFLRTAYPPLFIDVYDSADRAGGVIRSERISGCIVEGGPDSFLTMKKAASRLCDALGLGTQLIGSSDASRKTFIFDEGGLKALPEGFLMMVPTRFRPLVTTDLLSWPGKLDALSDLFFYPQEGDCSVADFIERRFGPEVLQKIAEPMISGIYGANVERLSLQSALPQIWEMQKKGSLIRQMIRRRTENAESLFTTLANGMESLIVRLMESIQANFKLGQPVEELLQASRGWMIGDEVYDAIVIAGSRLPRIDMKEFDQLESLWRSVRRNSAIVTVLAFEGLHREGFGWLVPATQRRSILACTYVSNKFPKRSPDNRFLVRAFIGGAQAAKWIGNSDEEIRQEVQRELNRIAGIDQEPVFCRIYRWDHAMPEYEVGHQGKMERVQSLIRTTKGLHLTGNVFSGVGIPDCIQHAEKIVREC